MKYLLVLHDTSKPNNPPATVRSTSPFSPISVGDHIIGQGFPLAIGCAYTVARIDHRFPTDDEDGLFHQIDAYLAP